MDTRRTALVTGASSGIGRAMAELLAAEGYNVVLVARRRERLEAIARSLRERCDVELRSLPADLSDSGTAARIAGELASSSIGVDLLVNNAGYSSPGEYHARSSAEHDAAFANGDRVARADAPVAPWHARAPVGPDHQRGIARRAVHRDATRRRLRGHQSARPQVQPRDRLGVAPPRDPVHRQPPRLDRHGDFRS